MRGRDDLDRWAFQLGPDICLYLGNFGSAQQIGFVQNHHIRTMKLLFKQFLKRAFMIKIIISLTLGLNRMMIMGKQTVAQCRPVQNSHHTIYRDP